MADRLMFPIGFDLESATKNAENEWDSKYAAQLEKALQKRPIKIKLSYDIKQLDNLEAVQKRLKELKLAPVTPETKGAISSLVSELKKLESILTKIQSLNQKSALISAKAATEEARTKDVLARTLAREEKLKKDILIWEQRVEQAKKRTAIAEERYRKAVEGTARAYSSTEGYISRLLRRTAVLFGIHQVTRFAERLREVTAEFELQRVSLGAIIQDQEKANALFGQIKTFAVQSPFEIKDLVGYVKQLSAYRIETDKLFDTTKRLADVSAGLGVSLDRIILAYGQVRAASVLRGCLGVDTEILTTDGIKKVQDIQVGDKLLNEKNEIVTVQELIRGREQMYRVTQSNGMEYRVNENHILTLYKNGALHDVYVRDAIADTELLGVRYFEGELITYPITIEKDIVDDYYGFVLDGNKRFQLGDGTVTHNTEVRQFTEAGIPLIELLAEKFTALRGEIVSTGEVFDLISQRAVSFEMVAEIFEDMTNAGGMFYNMQEKQAATLAGQWSNLKDSLSIMYDEMGNTSGVRGAMEGIINLVKTLAENWQLVEKYMYDIVGGVAIAKVVGAYKSLANVVKKDVFSAYNQLRAAQRVYNAALAKEQSVIKTGIAADIAAAKAKTASAEASLRVARATAQAARGTDVLTFAWRKLTAVIKANWVGILIGAAITAYQVISHLVSKSNELKNALADIGAEGAKNITVMTRNFELLANKAVQAADGSKAQKDALDELQRTYRDMIPTHLLTIENLRNMAGSYNILTTAIQEYCRQQMFANQIETIVGNTTEKISKAQTKLRDKLKDTYEVITTGYSGDTPQKEAISLSFDERSIERAFAGIEKYARTTTDSVQDIIRNAFKDFAGIELTDKEVQAISELGGFANNMHTLVEAYREQETEIKKVTEQQKALTGEVGLYGDLIDAATEKINNFESANLQTGTYAFDTAKAKAAADEYVKVIKKIFQDSGLTFNDMWVDGQFIDIDSINQALINAGNKVSSQANKAFGKIATAYYELVPSDVFSKAINKKFEDVAGGMKVSMDLIKKYLKDSNTSIDDYVKNFFNSIEELEKKIQQTKALLQSPNLSESDRGKKSADLVNYENELAVLKVLIPFIQLFNVEKSKGGRSGGTDDRLSKLKEEVSLLEKIYNNYKKYTEYESKSDAQERINREFGKTLEIFKKYGIALPTTAEEFQSALRKLQDAMRKLPKSEKDVLELGFKIEQVNFDESKRDLESELKRLADEVSRTKTAKEFFDKMLNMTGDRELSANITMSVYGDTGKGLHDAIVAQIRNAFKGIDDTALNLAIGIDSVDYQALQKIFKDNLATIPDEQKKSIQQILDNQQKANAEWLLDTFKVYEQFKTFEEQRTTIVAQETEKRRQIEARADLSDKQKESLKMASYNTQVEKLNDIDWKEFKASNDWIKTFEDIDRLATPTIERLIVKLREFIDNNKDLTSEQLKTVMSEYDKLYDQFIQRNPFKAIVDGIKGYKAATAELAAARKKQVAAQQEVQQAQMAYDAAEEDGNAEDISKATDDLTDANEKLKKATKDVSDAQDEQKKSLSDIAAGLNAAANAASSMQSILSQVVDLFGVTEDSELGAFLQEVGKWLGIIAAALSLVASIIAIIDAGLAPLLAVMAGIAAIGALFSWLSGAKVRRANKEIERQQEILDSLEHSYERLQKAADQLFGSEFVANFAKQQRNLQAQIAATQKQLAAERSKGKKADDDKIKQYEEQIQSLKDELADMQSQVAERMLGTDLASAARSFAQAWLDAYKSFGDTRKAIEGEMQKLMENLIVEALLGQVMKTALEPVFEMFEGITPEQMTDMDFLKKVVDEAKDASQYANTGANVIASLWEQAGMNFREIGDDFTGISKDIATASEESILGLSSLINTSLYYVSNIDRNVAQIVAIMTGGGYEVASGEQLTDLITIQNQHLSYLPSIALYTSQTAERCERAAAACENIAENLNRVIKPNGVQGSYKVNTSL